MGRVFILFLLLAVLDSSRVMSDDVFVLTKDIKVPFGQEHVDLPVFSVDGFKIRTGIGYGIYFESWSSKVYACRIHLNERTQELKKGTVIFLDGRHEIEKTSYGVFSHNFFVKDPKEISHISLGAYINHYRSLLGENAQLVGRTFPESYR